jgi:hypothetical protein
MKVEYDAVKGAFVFKSGTTGDASSVIITDPIFQGMAISLLAGTIVSTVLTLIVIPLGCVSRGHDLCAVAAAKALSIARLNAGGGDVKLFSALKRIGIEDTAHLLWQWAHPPVAATAPADPTDAVPELAAEPPADTPPAEPEVD